MIWLLFDLNIVKTFSLQTPFFTQKRIQFCATRISPVQLKKVCLLVIDLIIWFRPSAEQGHDIISVAAGYKRLEVVQVRTAGIAPSRQRHRQTTSLELQRPCLYQSATESSALFLIVSSKNVGFRFHFVCRSSNLLGHVLIGRPRHPQFYQIQIISSRNLFTSPLEKRNKTRLSSNFVQVKSFFRRIQDSHEK